MMVKQTLHYFITQILHYRNAEFIPQTHNLRVRRT